MFFSGVCTYINAQQPGPVNSSPSSSISNIITTPKKSIGVRITSPVFGDHILINGKNYFNKNGEKLLIRGTSVFNSSLTGCGVSIIADGVKPYQITNGTGPKGKSDYSSWIYGFSPSYSSLKVGSNKITAKLSCEPKNLVAYYSVNVTGAISTTTPAPVAVKHALSATTVTPAPAPAVVKPLQNIPVKAITPSPLVNNSLIPNNQSILQPPPLLQPSPHFNASTALSPLYITTPNSSLTIQTPVTPPPVVPANNSTSLASTSPPATSSINNSGNPYLSPPPKITPSPPPVVPANNSTSLASTSPPSPPATSSINNSGNPYLSPPPKITPSPPPVVPANNATSPPLAPPAVQSSPPQTPPPPPVVPANNATSPPLAPPATLNNNTIPLTGQNNSAIENPKSMNIVIDTKGGGKSRAIVVVTRDLLTDKPIEDVSLNGSINDHTFSGITNSKGEYSKGISSILHKSGTIINVQVTASADGYKSDNANATFTISSISHSISDHSISDHSISDHSIPDHSIPDHSSPDHSIPDHSSSDHSSSDHSSSEFKTKIKSGAQDMASKIAKDVQSQLSKQGINIPLPFG